MPQSDLGDVLKQLVIELENFEDIAKYLLPEAGELPRLDGLDVFGGTLAVSGAVGGDLIIYLDFKQHFDLDARINHAVEGGKPEVAENLRRCQKTAGIAVLDVSGHRVTDAFLTATLHQAFLLGSSYELDMSGQITQRLFENLNTRFYKSSGANKFISMIYGEISEEASFRFLSAAQPLPAVFSNRHDRFMEIGRDQCVSFPPLGVLPSLDVIDRNTLKSSLGFKDHYEMNEWTLTGDGDILLLHTDGLIEHSNGSECYFPDRLERKLREVKHRGSRDIFAAIREDLLLFGEPTDDISIVVIKRT